MLKELIQLNEDMAVLVLAMPDCLPSAVLASSDVEGELAALCNLMVGVEGTDEYVIHVRSVLGGIFIDKKLLSFNSN